MNEICIETIFYLVLKVACGIQGVIDTQCVVYAIP